MTLWMECGPGFGSHQHKELSAAKPLTLHSQNSIFPCYLACLSSLDVNLLQTQTYFALRDESFSSIISEPELN